MLPVGHSIGGSLVNVLVLALVVVIKGISSVTDDTDAFTNCKVIRDVSGTS